MNANNNFENDSIMQLNLEHYDGPLDVLYNLVKIRKMDIFQLNIVDLTNQYLSFVYANLEVLQIDSLSSYLVMASYLIELKTKSLLPKYVNTQQAFDNELEIDKLRQQIFLYKQYKEVVAEFRNKQNVRFLNLSKPSDDMDEYIPDKIPEAPLPTSVDIDRLVKLWKKIIVKTNATEDHPLVINVNDINVEEIQADINIFVSDDNFNQILFSDYILALKSPSMNLEFICGVFMSLLVLVKEAMIILIQKEDDFLLKKINND